MSTNATEPQRYCLRCRHNLRGICGEDASVHRCPECGREFDPADRRTTSRYPYGESWAALANIARLLIFISAAITAITFIAVGMGYVHMHPGNHPMLLLVMPMLPLIFLVPVLIIVIGLAQALGGWNALHPAWLLIGLGAIVLFVSIVIGQWPLRINFALHQSRFEREAEAQLARIDALPKIRAQISGPTWIGLMRVRRIELLHNGNIGFQLSGDKGEGAYLVQCAQPDPGQIWYNCSTRSLGDNWYLVHED